MGEDILTVGMMAQPVISVFYHLTSSPWQVIKTRRQSIPALKVLANSSPFMVKKTFIESCNKSIIVHMKNIIKEQGYTGLYKGCGSLTLYSVLTWGIIPFMCDNEDWKERVPIVTLNITAVNFIMVLRTQNVLKSAFRHSSKSFGLNMWQKATPFVGLIPLLLYNYCGIPYRPIDQFGEKIPSYLLLVSLFIGYPLTYPLSTIAVNQQVLCIHQKESIQTTAKIIYNNGGWRAFYRGFGAYVATCTPIVISITSVLSFLLYQRKNRGEK